MRYYVFKVIHPSVSYDGVLRIEANTLDDAKKELSSRLNIEEELLDFQRVEDRNHCSNLERLTNELVIDLAGNAIYYDRLRTRSYVHTQCVNIGDVSVSAAELLNYSIAIDAAKHNIISSCQGTTSR